ncbi:MAG: S8 family serine peptidase [Phycisphaerales bacterium]|nr:S8 family serine peptidase [Phycisphaerales bacterium]
MAQVSVRSDALARSTLSGRLVAGTACLLLLLAGCPLPPSPEDSKPSVSGALIIHNVTPPASDETCKQSDASAQFIKAEDLFVGKSRGVERENIRVGEALISLQREFEWVGRETLLAIIDRHPDLALAAIKEITPEGPFLVSIGAADSAEATHAALAVLRNDLAIRAAEPNRVYRAKQAVQTLTPNDPSYPDQRWQYEMIGLPRAWAITTGSPDIRIAVLDDGIHISHPDLVDNLLPGYDFVDNKPDPSAPATPASNKANTHGTHVAGTVAAVGNNQLGVTGVTWGCKIVPVRVIGGAGADLVAAMRWSAGLEVTGVPNNPNPCRVINMSLGGLDGPACNPDPASTAIDDAIAAVEAVGTVVVAAAGNEATQCPAPQSSSPANQKNAISVAALSPDRTRAEYSNEAPTNFIAAPGGSGNATAEDVLSTYFEEPFQGTRTATYLTSQGTSMATPHVSGVIALMLSANPNLTPAQVRDILQNTAEDLGEPGRDSIFGFGLIRADRAVEAAANQAAPATAQGITLTPRIVAAPDPVEFNGDQISRTVTVRNYGAGNVTFQSGSAKAETGGNWLSVAFPAPGTATPFDLAVTVDRSNLAKGRYRGRIEATTSAGRTVIAVELVVAGTVDVGDIKVALVKPDDGSEVASTVTNVASGYRYQITNFPAGEYLVIATSADKGVLQYRGMFPSLVEAESIKIDRPVKLDAFAVDRANGSVRQRGASGAEIQSELLAAVYEAGSGEPIAGATVSIPGGPSSTSDVSGQAALFGITGPVTITAAAPGYSTMTFVGINSSFVEFELEPAGDRGEDVTLTVTATGLATGEAGVVSAIVDGAIRDFARITADNPTAALSVEEGDELSVAVVVSGAGGTVTKWSVEEVEPLFEAATVEIEARTVASSASTTGTFQAAAGSLQAAATYAVLALSYGDSDKESILGGVFDVPVGQPFTLSRAGVGVALDAVVKGRLVALVVDAEANASMFSTSGSLAALAAEFSGTFRAPPVLVAPTAGETGTAPAPTLSFTNTPGGSLSLIVIEGPGEFLWEIFVPTGTTTVSLPVLTVGGLTGATAYQWHVEDYVIPGFDFNRFSLDFRDFSQSATESGPRTFTTAP